MSTLEELIDARLEGDATLIALLATFANTPAVFINGRVPSDTDRAWGASQYPRIVIWVDRQAQRDRKIQGQVSIDIETKDESGADPEAVRTRLQQLLDGVAFQPSNEPVSRLRYRNDVQYREPRDELLINGLTLEFDMSGFTTQTTYSPEPISAINTAIQSLGTVQTNPTSWGPSDTFPAVYTELEEVTGQQTWPNTIVTDGRFRIHILTSNTDLEHLWIRKISEYLMKNRNGRVLLDNDDDLLVNRVRTVQTDDPMRTGQIIVEASFGSNPDVVTAPLVVTIMSSGIVYGPLARWRDGSIRLNVH